MDASNNISTSYKSQNEQASTSSVIQSPPKKVNITGVYRVEKVGPVFRIIDPYVKRKDAKVAAAQRVTEVLPNTDNEKREKGELFADDRGPIWHHINNPMVTRPIITENLSRQFECLPIHGAPQSFKDLEDYQKKLIREFVGCDLDDAEYEELENYCNPDMLKTGLEFRMVTRAPIPGEISKNLAKDLKSSYFEDEEISDTEEIGMKELHVLEKLRLRKGKKTTAFSRQLKYRGTKLVPLIEQRIKNIAPGSDELPPDLEPGKDVLFRVRIYRPFLFSVMGEKKNVRGRHSVFDCDIVLLGRQPLSALRDAFICRNDVDMRVDLSNDPRNLTSTSAKEVFPSGFMFINNTFYVDGRPGCKDLSAKIRHWAEEKELGKFPVKKMEDFTLGQVLVKIGYPEVYVHQGNCEHVFIFSEIRLLSRSDPLHTALYPCHTAISQNQIIYCNTCAEFGAKWLVTGACRVPFDPAFFCDTCFHKYLYIDGRKIDNFQAYAYRGNELNLKNTKSSWILR